MSSFLWHTNVDMTCNYMGLCDEDKYDLWNPRYYYQYQLRGSRYRDPNTFTSLWPRPRMSSGDPSSVGLLGGQDSWDGGSYEPLNAVDTGSYRPSFIHGVCVDGSGNPLGGATLDLFLTATDTWVCSGTTDTNGIYSLPTTNVGVNHYVVANYGPNTLVGASVNTLQPVNSPW